jgi:hypothetical protein
MLLQGIAKRYSTIYRKEEKVRKGAEKSNFEMLEAMLSYVKAWKGMTAGQD